MLSIVIPVYNELDTWRELLALVESVEMPAVARQIILVDDGSNDGTGEQLKQFADAVAAGTAGADGFTYKVLFQDPNQGKGAALRTGFDAADGEIVVSFSRSSTATPMWSTAAGISRSATARAT